MARVDPSLYSLIIVQRDPPRPWQWAILKSGLKNPIQRSTRSFATEPEARQDGEAALSTLIEALQARHLARKPHVATFAGVRKADV
ncbi:MAG: hypothetical protein JNJ53_08875 [Rhizobiales bacterium]|nr:hypothetical protein [Hyphomicrobiales bacterium]